MKNLLFNYITTNSSGQKKSLTVSQRNGRKTTTEVVITHEGKHVVSKTVKEGETSVTIANIPKEGEKRVDHKSFKLRTDGTVARYSSLVAGGRLIGRKHEIVDQSGKILKKTVI